MRAWARVRTGMGRTAPVARNGSTKMLRRRRCRTGGTDPATRPRVSRYLCRFALEFADVNRVRATWPAITSTRNSSLRSGVVVPS